ncbi:hypothetical protein Dvina_25990 [Dactylosporangium vinaceum]|uniref:Uncharacterized protein n=1 Tax=Dactylosporangium vinaceum TaxID=53362 RepID=A0ABV5MDD9_9ACTN|nr:hypothetical protein [Dactylosporangium vinaceum]UAC01194.1 hypothetical protein Dvina_25990 [Dactylosporangium vinaceum]
MTNRVRPPVPVLTVVIIFALFTLFALIALAVSVRGSGFGEDAGISLGLAAVCGVVGSRLWFGAQIARWFAVAIGVFMVAVAVFNASTPAVALLYGGLGLAVIGLLTGPRSAREFFARGREVGIAR